MILHFRKLYRLIFSIFSSPILFEEILNREWVRPIVKIKMESSLQKSIFSISHIRFILRSNRLASNSTVAYSIRHTYSVKSPVCTYVHYVKNLSLFALYIRTGTTATPWRKNQWELHMKEHIGSADSFFCHFLVFDRKWSCWLTRSLKCSKCDIFGRARQSHTSSLYWNWWVIHVHSVRRLIRVSIPRT